MLLVSNGFKNERSFYAEGLDFRKGFNDFIRPSQEDRAACKESF